MLIMGKHTPGIVDKKYKGPVSLISQESRLRIVTPMS